MKGKDNCRQFCILLHALMLVTLMISYSPNSCADVYILENWDSGTPPSCWPCKEAPSCCSESWNGWETRDYSCDRGGSESGLSTKIYHSPPCSYYQNRPANDYFTCDIWKWLPEPYPTKIYLRFYVFFTCNWISFDNPAYSTSEFIHLIFTNTARSGAGFRFNLRDHVSASWPYECMSESDPQMYFEVQDGSVSAGRGTAPYDCFNLHDSLNQWLCIEFMVDAINDEYSMWINGDQKVNNASTPVTQSNFSRIIISGFSSYLRDYTGDFYIDDIVVADSYIGPIGVDEEENAPSPPKNLREAE